MIIYGMPETKVIDHKYSEFTKDLVIFSEIIGIFVIPKCFVMDWESVPIIKGTSKIGGAGHDYLSRIDSIPVVTKKVAADVYLEIMKHRGTSYWRRYAKYWFVRVWPGYFHKKYVSWKFKRSGKTENATPVPVDDPDFLPGLKPPMDEK